MKAFQQLGVVNFLYPWRYENTNMNNHIATFYEIDSFIGENFEKVDQFLGQDSVGSIWLPLEELTEDNSSLLVLKAKEYIQKGTFIDKGWILDKWNILDSPVY